jgi:hypothetical protein
MHNVSGERDKLRGKTIVTKACALIFEISSFILFDEHVQAFFIISNYIILILKDITSEN